MNIHKNARLTLNRRIEMIEEVVQEKADLPSIALRYGVSVPTVRKWLARYLAEGVSGLIDRSSRPRVSPRALVPRVALAVIELRKKRLTQRRIAQALSISLASVSRVLSRAGLSKWSALDPAAPVLRYEHAAAGDLLHIDIKTLGAHHGCCRSSHHRRPA